MNYNQVIVCIVLFCVMLFGLQAQNTLYVKDGTGNSTQYQISTLRSFTFTYDEIKINKIQGVGDSYLFSNLSKFVFGNTNANKIETVGNDLKKLSLFPSPVFDQLNIKYYTTSIKPSAIKIYDLGGHVVVLQTIFNMVGENNHCINVSDLPNGVYLFSIKNENSIEVSKFIKTK